MTQLPISVDTLIAIVTFIGAVIYQSAMLKRNSEITNERLTRLEENSNVVTKLLIANEAKRVRLEHLEARVAEIEKRCLAVISNQAYCSLHHHLVEHKPPED